MHAKDVIRGTLDASDMILKRYVDDLTDEDLLLRPVPGMNHVAWQLGHLISAERHFIEKVRPGMSPELPAGFAERHGRDVHDADDPGQFATKAEYLRLWDAQRAATKAVLDAVSDEELTKELTGLPPFAPNVAAALNLCGTHALMHLGQFVAVRRSKGKPIAI